ncbi:putative T6SS immunity periplasmic lipoprotein [Serratia rubidaea]|uniref:putative T6SS immunity periplasmic lipoprotein n=1 Tax=Serratia rubidaea TaxID=61652 RepID=UPI001F3B81B0|nr:putative T6SS immunity periplasmic lipoprotein [Serratia rubidaea]
MMKYCALAVLVFLLTGCPGPADRAVPRIPATVVVKDNSICPLSPMRAGEQITALQIYSDAGDKLIKLLDDAPVYAPQDGCLPLFGYAFLPGKNYVVAYDVAALNQAESHLIVAEFSVSSDLNGKISVGD